MLVGISLISSREVGVLGSVRYSGLLLDVVAVLQQTIEVVSHNGRTASDVPTLLDRR